jgi:hypothetical protein
MMGVELSRVIFGLRLSQDSTIPGDIGHRSMISRCLLTDLNRPVIILRPKDSWVSSMKCLRATAVPDLHNPSTFASNKS